MADMGGREQMSPLEREIIEGLRAVRRAKKVSCEELSRRLGDNGYRLSAVSVRSYENGRTGSLPVSFVEAAATVLGVPVAQMLVPAGCLRCAGHPPVGFTCNSCGTGGDAC